MNNCSDSKKRAALEEQLLDMQFLLPRAETPEAISMLKKDIADIKLALKNYSK
jgi:ribosomal protein L29